MDGNEGMQLEKLRIDRPAAGSGAQADRRGAGPWLVALALILLGGWFGRDWIGAGVERLSRPAVTVVRAARSDPLRAGTAEGTAANGYIVARRRAALSADAPGRIVALYVEEGSVVKQGELVAQLYAAEYEAAVASAQASLASAESAVARALEQEKLTNLRLDELASALVAAQARAADAVVAERLAQLELERAEKLLADGIETQELLDARQAGHEQSQAKTRATAADETSAAAALASGAASAKVAAADVAEARSRIPVAAAERERAVAALAKTEVRAPFDGIVVLKDAEVGEVVSPNSQGVSSRGSVATLVDFSSLEVQVELPETSLAAVSIGAPTNVYLDAFPGRVYRGLVERIWPTANRQKATVEVRVRFERIAEEMRPEMGVRVVFDPQGETGTETSEGADTRGGIMIPDEALVTREGASGVWLFEEGVVRFQAVGVGAREGSRARITSGLSGGERVVLRPPNDLADGDHVRVTNEGT